AGHCLWLFAVLFLLVTPVFAQDDDLQPGPPPPLDTSKPLHQEAGRHVAWFGRTAWGKILGVLVVGLGALRFYSPRRVRFTRAALEGRGGARARRFAEQRVRALLAYRKYEEAAELVLVMGQAGWSGPPNDRTRVVEAAELFMRGGRNVRAAELLVEKGKFLRAAEAYERAL